MYVDFKCQKCEYTEEVSYSLQVGPPKLLKCPMPDCKGHMMRVWGGTAIRIPEHMKATPVGVDNDTMKALGNRIAHNKPSGRDKIYY